MAKIIYELDTEDDEFLLRNIQQANDYYEALRDIYTIVRTELKHGEEELSDHIDGILEEIKGFSAIVMID